MRIFKITKTYMVAAADEAAAKTMVTLPKVGELFLAQQVAEELPPEIGRNRQLNAWLVLLKQQLLG